MPLMAPALIAFVAAALWGIWWIPIRLLDSLGFAGAWGGVLLNGGAVVTVLLVMALWRVPFRIGRRSLIGAMLAGVAMGTYSTAINYSDVVRVILLFYLAPTWSKLIEWAFLGHRWTMSVSFALITSLLGAYLVLGPISRCRGCHLAICWRFYRGWHGPAVRHLFLPVTALAAFH